MALSIKNDEADRLARELSELTGESLTEAIVQALRERLERQRAQRPDGALADRLMAIGRLAARRRRLDDRSAEDIVGYDRDGLPR